jgi:hypothetical protein
MGKTETFEAVNVSKSSHEPVIDIGASQSCLSSLQKKDEINCFWIFP